jgi:hypothetical protein
LVVVVLLFAASRANADSAQERSVIADTLDKLGGAAHALAKSAQSSDDRGARKKFASAAIDLGDDLKGLGRRAAKLDVALGVIVQGLGEIDKDANGLVEVADEISDKQERKNLRAQAVQLQQQVTAAKRIIEAIANKKEEAKAQPAAKQAMADGAFNQLVASVRGASFDEDKVGVVKDAARLNYFTANQIATMMGLLSFDEGKIDLAVAAFAHCVDPQNSFVLYKKLSFDDSREKLRKQISR